MGMSPSTVSVWNHEGKIDGATLVQVGGKEKIKVDIQKAQLA
jgi:hypothetical protein